MTDAELATYMRTYRSEHGDLVPLSKLLRTFKGFQPVYTPRRKPADRDLAERKAKRRAMYRLADELVKREGELTVQGAKGSIDVNALVEEAGWGPAKPGRYVMPDSFIALDEKFVEFVQSLSSTIGGRKTPSPGAASGSTELEEFRHALRQLRRSRSQKAQEFVKVYDRVQSKLRLPRTDAEGD